MNFFSNSKFTTDILEVARQFFPNEKFESFETEVEDGLNFFVSVDGKIERYRCSFNGHVKCRECDTSNHIDHLRQKRITKRMTKLCVYDCLSETLGRDLPWGALTGIRPTKFAYDLIKEGTEDVFETLRSTFKVEPKKVELVEQILNNQKGLINSSLKNADFYVNIPFCVSKCSYCSFVSGDINSQKKFVLPYITALKTEINSAQMLAKEFGYKLENLYVGGGTPTSLSCDELENVLAEIWFKPNEFTVEAGRPDTIDLEKLKLFKAVGVNRISVNPQTFSQKTLDLINRRHTVKDIFDKFELTKKVGFDVNMDLIAGLPGETFFDFKNSVDTAVSLRPENITVHTLALKSGAVLKEKTTIADNEVEIGKMLDYSVEKLHDNGYEPYYMYRQKYVVGNFENVGYSLKGKQCRYNIDIMEEVKSILACGANAISKRVFLNENRIERLPNLKDFDNYNTRVDELCQKKGQLFKSR